MEHNIHEDCGVALIRLLKPLSYYQKKYGSWKWGLGKLYLMMEKQHNRGQEGAGIASVKHRDLRRGEPSDQTGDERRGSGHRGLR